MKTYKSKIGLGILLPFLAIMMGICVLFIKDQAWIAMILSLLIVAVVFYTLRNTYCSINDNILNVRVGFLLNTDIEISTIKSITETNSVFSAPALPQNRMEIFYNTYDSIIISTPDKAQFITDLQAINPDITMTWLNKK